MIFTQLEEGRWTVTTPNGASLGELIRKEDGFFDYWPDDRGGCFPAYILREIADKLDQINEPHRKALDDFFKTQCPVCHGTRYIVLWSHPHGESPKSTGAPCPHCPDEAA